MTKRIMQIIAVGILTGLALGTTGCKTVCQPNKKAGLATIVCQPMDVEAKSRYQPVEFRVLATGRGLTYQWYFNDEPLPAGDEKNRGYEGVTGPKLTINDITSGKIGDYRCEIDSIDCLGIPLRTSTRSASLGTAFSMAHAIASPTQRLPKPGAPTTSPCGGKHCASLSFRNVNNSGYIPSSTDTKCVLTVFVDNAILPQTAYDILVYEGANKFCATNGPADTKFFDFTAGTHKYFFTVYFKCPSPTNRPLVTLKIDWQ